MQEKNNLQLAKYLIEMPYTDADGYISDVNYHFSAEDIFVKP